MMRASGEAANTNCMVFGLTRRELEPTIYSTRGEHANLYTIDAVGNIKKKIQNDRICHTTHDIEKVNLDQLIDYLRGSDLLTD